MNKAFEKILERLEEEKMSYFLTIANTGDEKLDYAYEQVGDALDNAIEIVNHEAAEYNNGWIPVEERMPEEAFGCLVTVIDCNPVTLTEFENILPYVVGYDGDSWNDADGEEIPFEVIAWRKLPTPYQPKGER